MKGAEVKVNTLIYSMWDKADDILKSFELTEAQAKEYETVKGKFNSHFIKSRISFSRGQNSYLPNCMPWQNIVNIAGRNDQRPLSGTATGCNSVKETTVRSRLNSGKGHS